MLRMRRAFKDILAGSVFIIFGLTFVVISATYEIGTPLEMGPGFFPIVLGGILVLLGILVIVKGLVAGEGDDIGVIPWRAAGLIVVGVMFFGFTVRGLGLVPTLFVTTLLAALAGHRTGVLAGAVIAGGMTILCVLIFIMALQLRLPLIGPWIPV